MYYYGINDPFYDPMQTAEAWRKYYDFCNTLNNFNPNSPAEVVDICLKAMDFRMSCDKLPCHKAAFFTKLAASAFFAKFRSFKHSIYS